MRITLRELPDLDSPLEDAGVYWEVRDDNGISISFGTVSGVTDIDWYHAYSAADTIRLRYALMTAERSREAILMGKPVKKLRELAIGMPYRSEANKKQLVNWLLAYRPGVVMNCPYKGCTFQGTEDEVEDHVIYMTSVVQDDEHKPENRK